MALDSASIGLEVDTCVAQQEEMHIYIEVSTYSRNSELLRVWHLYR